MADLLDVGCLLSTKENKKIVKWGLLHCSHFLFVSISKWLKEKNTILIIPQSHINNHKSLTNTYLSWRWVGGLFFSCCCTFCTFLFSSPFFGLFLTLFFLRQLHTLTVPNETGRRKYLNIEFSSVPKNAEGQRWYPRRWCIFGNVSVGSWCIFGLLANYRMENDATRTPKWLSG